MTSCDGEAGAILGMRECSGYSFVRNLARFKLKEKTMGKKHVRRENSKKKMIVVILCLTGMAVFMAMLAGINIDTIKAGPVSVSGTTGMLGTKIARLVRKQKVLIATIICICVLTISVAVVVGKKLECNKEKVRQREKTERTQIAETEKTKRVSEVEKTKQLELILKYKEKIEEKNKVLAPIIDINERKSNS